MLIRKSSDALTTSELLAQLCDSLKELKGDNEYRSFQDDPVGFGEKVLGETFTGDVARLMASVRDHVITVAKSANATGKTHAAARIAVWFFKSFPESQVYTAAAPPESNLKKLLWGEIGGLIHKHVDLFKGDATKDLHIQRSPQSFLTGVTIPSSGTAAQREARFSGKHAPNILFILDEGDAIPDEVYKGIESCMSGGHARLLVMFNPRQEAGEVFRMERDGRANVVKLSALDHPNVVTGNDVIPGAVTRQTTVRRINEWCRPLTEGEKPDSESFDLPAFLEDAVAHSQSGQVYPPLVDGHYKIIEPAFNYMVLGDYPAQASNQLISREWVTVARSRWDAYASRHGDGAPAASSGVMGLDVGEFGSDANAACFRYGGFVERIVTWQGLDTIATAERAVVEFKARKAITGVNVDATGVGAGVAPYVQRQGIPAHRVMAASSPTRKTEIGEFALLRDQLWWLCREWLRTDPGAMLPPDEMLIEELIVPTYAVYNGRIKVMKKDLMRELLKRSPDRADALCLTFYEPPLLFPQFADRL